MTVRSSRTRWAIALIALALLAGAAVYVVRQHARPRNLVDYGPIGGSAKKGVGTWHFHGVTDGLPDSGVSWYYNWQPSPSTSGKGGPTFIPTAWGKESVNARHLRKAKSSGNVLLTFNEPDRADQANLPVETAIDLWPQLMATGMRLASPAPSADAATPGSWLDTFMTQIQARGYRVDFIAVHWYGADFDDTAVEQLRSYLQSVHDRYGLPIWLTEFSLIRFADHSPDLDKAIYPTAEQQVRFITQAVTMLENLPYVERYAWFALPTLKGGRGSGLCAGDGALTQAGRAYRAAA